MNLKLFGIIAIFVVLFYGILLIPYLQTAEAGFYESFKIYPERIQTAILNFYEDQINQHDPNIPVTEQQTYLDKLQQRTNLIIGLPSLTAELDERKEALLPRAQAILDAGISSIIDLSWYSIWVMNPLPHEEHVISSSHNTIYQQVCL